MGNLRDSMTEDEWNELGKAANSKKINHFPESCKGFNIASQLIFTANKAKGFWDKPRNVGEMLMLVTSELGEAMEAHRKGRFANWSGVKQEGFGFEQSIKDTFEDEIADAIIRLLDMCGGLSIDIERHINAKLQYNQSRPHLHGKKY
jgi:NTP pyrophosphatase (non-canonical NTP hydrolase)